MMAKGVSYENHERHLTCTLGRRQTTEPRCEDCNRDLGRGRRPSKPFGASPGLGIINKRGAWHLDGTIRVRGSARSVRRSTGVPAGLVFKKKPPKSSVKWARHHRAR